MRNIGLNVFMWILVDATQFIIRIIIIEYSSNIQYIIGFIYKDCKIIYMCVSLNVC